MTVSFLNRWTPTWWSDRPRMSIPRRSSARGINAIITDLDNTLVPWRKYDIAPSVIEWLAKIEVEFIKICIASNTLLMSRLQQLAETMGIPFVDRVRKPWVGGFVRSMDLMASGTRRRRPFLAIRLHGRLGRQPAWSQDNPAASTAVKGRVHPHADRENGRKCGHSLWLRWSSISGRLRGGSRTPSRPCLIRARRAASALPIP